MSTASDFSRLRCLDFSRVVYYNVYVVTRTIVTFPFHEVNKMAKVTLPILGVSASGTVGDAITFGTWRGVNYARARVIPANPQTAAQTAQRSLMKWVVAFWQGLPGGIQQTFINAAAGRKMTGFNLFTKKNLVSLKTETYNDLAVVSPGQAGAPSVATIVATGGAGSINATVTLSDVVYGTVVDGVYFLVAKRQDVRQTFLTPVFSVFDDVSPYEASFTSLAAGVYVIYAFATATDAKGQRFAGTQLSATVTVT